MYHHSEFDLSIQGRVSQDPSRFYEIRERKNLGSGRIGDTNACLERISDRDLACVIGLNSYTMVCCMSFKLEEKRVSRPEMHLDTIQHWDLEQAHEVHTPIWRNPPNPHCHRSTTELAWSPLRTRMLHKWI